MKKIIITFATISLLSSAALAGDMGKSYFQVRGDYDFGGEKELKIFNAGTTAKTDLKSGWGAGLAIGHYATDAVRTEIGIDYRSRDTKNASINGFQVADIDEIAPEQLVVPMANMYYDFINTSNFVPYFGAGFGMAHNIDKGRNALAYQAMAGLNFKMPMENAIFVGYKFFGTGKFKENVTDANLGVVTGKIDYNAHIIEVGYRVNF